MDIIRDNPDEPWIWNGISSNPNITIDIIKANPYKCWDWYTISYKSDMTMDIIKANPDIPWDWCGIARNTFQKEKELFFDNSCKKYIAAYKIQQFWFKHTLSPEYVIGRKFINKKFDECFT